MDTCVLCSTRQKDTTSAVGDGRRLSNSLSVKAGVQPWGECVVDVFLSLAVGGKVGV